MAGKITDLTAMTWAVAAPTDLIEVVDVSDPTGALTGTNKKMALGDVLAQPIQTVAGTTYTVLATDSGMLTRLTGTATVTLPSGALTVGQRADFVCIGGAATFALGSGATWDVSPTPSAVARAVGSFVTAIKMGATTWALTGDLA